MPIETACDVSRLCGGPRGRGPPYVTNMWSPKVPGVPCLLESPRGPPIHGVESRMKAQAERGQQELCSLCLCLPLQMFHCVMANALSAGDPTGHGYRKTNEKRGAPLTGAPCLECPQTCGPPSKQKLTQRDRDGRGPLGAWGPPEGASRPLRAPLHGRPSETGGSGAPLLLVASGAPPRAPFWGPPGGTGAPLGGPP